MNVIIKTKTAELEAILPIDFSGDIASIRLIDNSEWPIPIADIVSIDAC
jgi:hypothetical protein